jgi:STAS domain-containing protein
VAARIARSDCRLSYSGWMAPISAQSRTRWPLSVDLAYGQFVSSDFPADILELQVAEHDPDARVVTVVGEIDALTAPKLTAFLTEQLAVAKVMVVNLDGVQFLSSADALKNSP